MKKLVLASCPTWKSIQHVLLILILGTISIRDLSASETDNDKNQFTFSQWKHLHKLNTEALESNAHRAWFDMYVNTLAKKAYVEKSSIFPVGSIVVKPLYSDLKRSETAKLTIMIKMEQGYDAENGDWWYGVYDKTGREGYNQGKIKSCIKCHRIAKETDYMFSESTMESINEEDW